jgi:predicted peroxiredoxin
MSNPPRNLVVLVTNGLESEKSTLAFTMANGGITAGLKVSVFLTASGVDVARKGATDLTHVHPFDPLGELMQDFLRRGGQLWACTSCITGRGYTKDDLIEGTIITGASVMHELIQAGAATLSF